MDDRDARIADLEGQLAAKSAGRDPRDVERIAELERKVEELTKLVATLMEQLGRNSRNSQQPPSSDGPGARPGGEGKSELKRKRGGQPGHRGSKRELIPSEQVDSVIELYPRQCESCWKPLAPVTDSNATRYQHTEVPPLRPQTTEYRRHAVKCCCGYTTLAKMDEVPSSPFGPRLMSLVGLLTGVYHLSRRETVTLIHDVLGVQMSLGAVSAVEGRVSAAVALAVEEVCESVAEATVKHADATSWLEAGKLRSLWVIATPIATIFKILLNGTAGVVKPIFGACKGILVSDRATVFSFWKMANRQICWAHLLRKFVSFSERTGPAQAFGKELLEFAALVFRYWKDLKKGNLDRDRFRAWMAPVRLQFEAALERAVAAEVKELSGSCADILAHREALWTFVDRTDVDPTNNHGEREVRAFVLWRKRCFGAQSDRGHRFAERVMTVAHTARKQGRNVLAFLTACCEAQLARRPQPSLFAAQQLPVAA